MPERFLRITNRVKRSIESTKGEYELRAAEEVRGDFEKTVVISAENLIRRIGDPLDLLKAPTQGKIIDILYNNFLLLDGEVRSAMIAIYMTTIHLEAARKLISTALVSSDERVAEDMHCSAWDLVCEASVSLGYLKSISINKKIYPASIIAEYTKVSQSKNGAKAHPQSKIKAEAMEYLRSRSNWHNKKTAADQIVEEFHKRYPGAFAGVADPCRIVMGWIDSQGQEIKSHFTGWGKKSR